MQFGNLGVVDKKVLGALIILSKEDNTVEATLKDIANVMGYKEVGGALTFAIRILERDNFIIKLGQGRYKLLI